MKSYLLFGFSDLSLEEARRVVEATLHISFVARDSLYRCGLYYVFTGSAEDSICIQLNRDPFEDIPNEQQFPTHAVVMYVNAVPHAEELRTKLLAASSSIQFLKGEWISHT